MSSYTAATRSFLQNNPFILQVGNDLCGAVFVGAEQQLSEAEERRIKSNYDHPGLLKCLIYRLPPGGASSDQIAISNPDLSLDSTLKNEASTTQVSSHA